VDQVEVIYLPADVAAVDLVDDVKDTLANGNAYVVAVVLGLFGAFVLYMQSNDECCHSAYLICTLLVAFAPFGGFALFDHTQEHRTKDVTVVPIMGAPSIPPYGCSFAEE